MTTTKAQASFRAEGIARFTAGEPLPAEGAAPKHILALSGADAQISRDRLVGRHLSRVPFSQHCLKIDNKRLFEERICQVHVSLVAFNRHLQLFNWGALTGQRPPTI